jgi:4-amino-4-deoxy-L-arabinose transferase-like glycosyltransferase
LNGFFSPPAPDINLWSGPGYPLFIAPFVWFKAPLISIKLANALLQYLSIVLLFLAIKKYVSRQYALIFSFSWAFYYIAYQELHLMLTEPLTSFLSALIVFLLTRANDPSKENNKYLIFTGFVIGFLALTKIIFGYVIIGIFIFYVIIFLFRSCKVEGKKGLYIMGLAFLINVPYLVYTQNLTGKFFYWGNSGGNSLYWMSTPVEGEFGDWNNTSFTANCGHDLKIPCNASLISQHHQKDIDYILQFPTINQDDEFKRLAINNIKANPIKYIRNCISNLSRLFFGIPSSYFYQREQTVYRIIPNSIVLTILIFSSIISIINFKYIKFEVKIIIYLTFLYLFLSTLVSAYPRQLYVIIPFLFFWFSYSFNKFLVIKSKP